MVINKYINETTPENRRVFSSYRGELEESEYAIYSDLTLKANFGARSAGFEGGCDDGGGAAQARATPSNDEMTPTPRMNLNVSVHIFSRLQRQPTTVTEESARSVYGESPEKLLL